jgi:hypothetical protein
VHRVGDNGRLWRLQSLRAERFFGECANARIARWQRPRFVREFSQLNSPPSAPRIVRCRHGDDVVIEQTFDKHIVSIRKFDKPGYHKFDFSLFQVAVERQHGSDRDIKHHAWMPLRKAVDDRQDWPTGRVLAASNAQLTRRWITEELDILDALSELIEDCKSALDDRVAILRRPDAARTAIEQADTEGVFEIGNRS